MTTIPPQCKRLAEVDFPIRLVGANATREKAGPKGHPSMLFLWWARRPLASSRALLLAMLLPDPSDPACPAAFRSGAAKLLTKHLEERDTPRTPEELREQLLDLVARVSSWDADSELLNTARSLVMLANGTRPTALDPFSGGGSIPLEALRLGADVVAGDLNPVALTGLKVLLEDIPANRQRFGQGLRTAGEAIQNGLATEASKYFAAETEGYRATAYLWARTVTCESPNCGMEIPLLRSMWLAKKGKRKAALRCVVRENPFRLEWEVFAPKAANDVMPGTVSKAKATCPRCKGVLGPDRVRFQLERQTGGGDVELDDAGQRIGGATLLAVIRTHPIKDGRHFRVATTNDYKAIQRARRELQELLADNPDLAPTESLPPIGTLGFRVQRYGITRWFNLFTTRQLLILLRLVKTIQQVSAKDETLRRALALAFGRVAMSNMSLTRWNPVGEKIQHTFGRQALPIVWDFAEVVISAEAPGNWRSGFELVAQVSDAWPGSPGSCTVQQADACDSPLPDASIGVWFTDPPYYDAVPYSDLSDFFFVWLKRILPPDSLQDPFDATNSLTPKEREAVQDETKIVDGKPKDKEFFESAMARAFREGRRVLSDDGIGSVVFAHKTTEGWEALLNGLIQGGWVITASWPIATEMGSRLRAQESAALATSVHLICRPRPVDAPAGDWADVARELPPKVRAWMERLDKEDVRGADLVFACIGPAMEVYSKYSRVVDAEDREIPLGGDPTASEPHKQGYLAKVWEVVGRLALEKVLGKAAGSGALEEDARLSALFLWTLQGSTADQAIEVPPETSGEDEDEQEGSKPASGGFTLPYDVVRRFAQPLGIHLEDWEGRIIATDKGIVRLLPISERSTQLFGREGAEALRHEIAPQPGKTGTQTTLFPVQVEVPSGPSKRAGKRDQLPTMPAKATTLDRVHAALLLQASGQTSSLRAALTEERKRGPEFERLANAFAALYPIGTDERRLVEAMLLAMPK